MSRSIARLIAGAVRAGVAPLSRRQRHRVVARVVENLMHDNLAQVDTARGPLKLLQMRSAFTASAVARFHTDEPETLAWIDGFRPGDVFWDIGANIGLYALYAALGRDVRVLAFEPSGWNFGVLVEHIELNRLGDRVSPFCVALGDRNGIGELFMSQTGAGHGGNTLDAAQNQFESFTPAFRQAVLAFSIDGFRATYDLPAPTHVKIDVDGIEGEIVAGAAATLPHVSSILIEVQGRVAGEGLAPLEARLAAAGLVEDVPFRTRGSGRNRLYRRGA